MQKFSLLALCLLLCCTCACAPRHYGSPLTPPANLPELAVAPDDAAIATFLGSAADGESRVFSSRRLGKNIKVTAGRRYLSAFGVPCREGVVQGMRRVAACKRVQKDKESPVLDTWALAPDIMDNAQY